MLPVRELAAAGADLDQQQLTDGLGAALGTAAYMSPEQALGKQVDTRTDLFSFGILLYEMCTGRSPFPGDTTGELLIAIVQQVQITPAQLNPDVPDGLARIIDRCLEKDREHRYQHASEIRADLERVQRDPAAVVDRPSPSPQKSHHLRLLRVPEHGIRPSSDEPVFAAALAGASSRAAGYCHRDHGLLPGKHPASSRGFELHAADPRWRGEVPGRHGRVEALFGRGISDCTRNRADAGHGWRSGADAGSRRIHLPCRNITRRRRIVRDRTPGAELLEPGSLWRLPTLNGPPRRIGSLLVTDAAWSPDGAMLAYCNRGDLFLSDGDGSGAGKLASLGGFITSPQFSPDGRRIRFTWQDLTTGNRSLWEITVEGKHLHRLLPGWHQPSTDANGKWTADGKFFVFEADGQIWALPDKTGLFGQVDGKPRAAYFEPHPAVLSSSQQRRQKAFCRWLDTARDAVPLQPASG